MSLTITAFRQHLNDVVRFGSSIDPLMELIHLSRKESDKNINSFLDEEKNTAMHIACSLGKVGFVQELLRNGASINSPNGKDQTPLILAVKAAAAAPVGFLSRPQDPPSAADHRCDPTEMVRVLLAHEHFTPSMINTMDYPRGRGCTALHYVTMNAGNGNAFVVLMHLVNKLALGGAASAATAIDQEDSGECCRTPLMYACMGNPEAENSLPPSEDLLRYLLEKGADPTKKDALGRNILHLLAENPSHLGYATLFESRVTFLLGELKKRLAKTKGSLAEFINAKCAALPTDPGTTPSTPLHLAIRSGNATMVRTLLATGLVDLQAVDGSGVGYLDLAMQTAHMDPSNPQRNQILKMLTAARP